MAYLIFCRKFKINRKFNSDLNFVHQFFVLHSFIILFKKSIINKRKILSADCDINWTTFEGETPLFIACKSLSTDVSTNPPIDDVTNPPTNDVTNPPIDDVTTVNRLKVIRRILKREDANVNLPDNFGTTPLHLAAQAGNHLVTK